MADGGAGIYLFIFCFFICLVFYLIVVVFFLCVYFTFYMHDFNNLDIALKKISFIRFVFYNFVIE